MRRNRLLYIALIMLSAAFAALYISSLSLTILITVSLVPFISLLFLVFTAASVKVTMTPEHGQYAKKEAFAYKLIVNNRSLFPIYPAIITGTFHDNSIKLMLPVPPLSSASADIEGSFPFRGVYAEGCDMIAIMDVLKLFTIRRRIKGSSRITILPRELSILFSGKKSDNEPENCPMSRYGAFGDVFAFLRSYIEGDRLRSIHWKLTAKQEEPVVRQMERTSGCGVYIVTDITNSYKDDKEREKADTAVECALALCGAVAHDGDIARIIWFSSASPLPKSRDCASENDCRAVSMLLSDASPDEEPIAADFDKLTEFLPVGDRSPIVFSFPHIDTSLIRCAGSLSASTRRDITIITCTECNEDEAEQLASEGIRVISIPSPITPETINKSIAQ